jgi:hypothetical protein
MLTQTELQELLHYDPDTGIFTWKETRNQHAKAGDIAGGFQDKSGYLRIKINGKKYRSHRLAWLHAHGSWPANEIVISTAIDPIIG